MADHQQQGQPSPAAAPTTEPVKLPATGPAAETEEVPQERASPDAHFSAGSFFPISTSQASQHPSILDYRRENGRSYHRLSDGKYALPNDELEQERLDIVNHLWMLTLDGELCLCPKVYGAKRVLDIGTGTGIWAMDYADEHPQAEVIGVDLSPIQPAYVPVNCVFEVDDLEKEWMFTEPFDFIFARNMIGSFSDWEGVIAQAFDNLEPGGYFELHDSMYPLICDDGTLTEESPLMRWTLLMVEACERRGRSVTIGSQFPRLLEEAGFEDINVTNIRFPVSPWPKDPKLRLIGEWTQASLISGIEGLSLALFTRVLGWSVVETIVFCAQVRDQVKSTRYHGYWKGITVYGRKPLVENGHDRDLSSSGIFSTPDGEYVVL
ncbi:methyltransferase domain-containing protein [Colletotrichum falcatum]|nr:methyltransferase domain-containing protein [Colletotrichum falcatum]